MFQIFKKNKDVSPNENKKKANAHYYTLKVKEIIQETVDAITIVFESPAEGMTYVAGQFLTLITDINGEEVRRSYSLCTSMLTDKDPAVTIKRVEGGKMSNFFADSLKAADTIKVMQPMGNFTSQVETGNKRHLVLFGGGSGITPLMAITKEVLHGEPDSIVSMIYANRNINSIIFQEQLDEMQRNFEGRFQVIHILDDAPLNWQGPSGLLNPEKVKTLLERIPNWGVEKTEYFMCGPEGMMNNVDAILEELRIPKENIFRESFVAGITNKKEVIVEAAGDDVVVAREVKVIYDDEEYTFVVEPDKTILETALDMDIDLPYSCQSGLCTACRGKCLSGKVKMDEEEGLSESEREEGYVLTCVGHPLTDDVVIEIG